MDNKALTAFGGLDSLINDIEASDAAGASAELNEQAGGLVEFTKFLKSSEYTGEADGLSPWVFGKSNENLHPDNEYVVDPTTMVHGWMGWPEGAAKGQKPDVEWAPWTAAIPDKPAGLDHLKRAFKWRAVCRYSPIEEQQGLYIEVSSNKSMKRGYAELELALRNRMKQIAAAKAENDMATFERLVETVYPVVKLGFKTGVRSKYGKQNQEIIELIDWAGAIVIPEGAEPEEEAEVSEEAEEVEEVAKTTVRRRRRRD